MLLAPYLSIPKMAQLDFPYFPSQLLVLDRFENFKKIGRVHVPLLIVNGSRDEVIPPSQGIELYNFASEPRQFYSIPDRGHNDAFDDFAPLSIDWLDRVAAKNSIKAD